MLKILMIPILEVLIFGMTLGNFPDTEQSNFIAALNKERRDFANKNSISNMHELSWNEELQKTAETLIFTVSLPDAGKTWRYIMISDYDSGIQELNYEMSLHEKNPINRDVEKTLGPTGSVPGVEHILPLQKSVACAKKDKLKYDYLKILCLFGPEGKYPPSNVTIKKPGSDCSPGFQNNHGLCSRSPKTELTTPSETITVLNLVENTTASAGIVAPAENPTVPPFQQSAEIVVPATPTVPPKPAISADDSSSVSSFPTPAAPKPQIQMQTKNPQKPKTTTFYDKKLEEYDEEGGDVTDEDDVDPTTLSSFSSSIPTFLIVIFVLFILITFEE